MPTNKEHALFASFIRQHQSRVRAFIRSMGVETHAVDDIAQEAFLIAYRELDRFDSSLDFGYWLNGIARNIIRNESRKKYRQNRIMDEKLSHFLIEEFEQQYEPSHYEGDEVQALRDCINQLPEKSQNLVSKKYTQGENAKTISEHFEMTSTAVRLALMRIREKLRHCVDMKVKHG